MPPPPLPLRASDADVEEAEYFEIDLEVDPSDSSPGAPPTVALPAPPRPPSRARKLPPRSFQEELTSPCRHWQAWEAWASQADALGADEAGVASAWDRGYKPRLVRFKGLDGATLHPPLPLPPEGFEPEAFETALGGLLALAGWPAHYVRLELHQGSSYLTSRACWPQAPTLLGAAEADDAMALDPAEGSSLALVPAAPAPAPVAAPLHPALEGLLTLVTDPQRIAEYLALVAPALIELYAQWQERMAAARLNAALDVEAARARADELVRIERERARAEVQPASPHVDW